MSDCDTIRLRKFRLVYKANSSVKLVWLNIFVNDFYNNNIGKQEAKLSLG